MPKKSKGTDETQPGDVVYTHDDMVKFKVGYDKNWPKDTPKHMQEGSVHLLHEKHAKTLQEKGVGTITEYLNDKRDKQLDKDNKTAKLAAVNTTDSAKNASEAGKSAGKDKVE